ncbi:MAG: glycerophosphodiester phosphodiesterase family protein [Desulfatibacillaceae bacterium]
MVFFNRACAESRLGPDHPLLSLPLAHRGLHDHADGVYENTMPAFERAVERGYGIELDVQLLRDGNLVVFHDDDLTRAADRKERIADLDFGQVRELVLFGDGPPPPMLPEVLALVAGRAPLYIEVKNDGGPGPAEQSVAAALADYTGPCAVASFNPFSMAWFAAHRPRLFRGLVSGGFEDEQSLPRRLLKKAFLSTLALNRLAKPDFVAYDVRRLPHRAVSRYRRSGIPVVAWTCKSPEQGRYAEQYADNVVFEGYLP